MSSRLRIKGFRSHQKRLFHYLGLFSMMLLGAMLRFWQLDSKPLWLDEVLTAIFAMGRSYNDVPVQEFFSILTLNQFFTIQPDISCPQIAHTVTTESVHPPLFFCLMYGWMGWLHPNADHWIWALRALPALWGTGAIAASYALNRIAFSATAGLTAAALMAVSPFAVYLSQEARHYTLPMVLITLALVGLVQMQQDLRSRHTCRPWVWIGWSVINSIGLYTHYFCLLAWIAQLVALGSWMVWRRQSVRRRYWVALLGAAIATGLSYLPWLPTLFSHMGRPETDWLEFHNTDWTERIAPIYQTVIGWVLMAIALPVEDQPDTVVLPAVVLMVVFTLWLGWYLYRKFRSLWCDPLVHPALFLMTSFTIAVLAQFFCIVYGLGKDITVVPRYNFVYYPGICALLGICLSHFRQPPVVEVQSAVPPKKMGFYPDRLYLLRPMKPFVIVFLAGLLSSVFVIYGLTFQKSYNPSKVVENLAEVEPSLPMLLVIQYRSLQEIALGFSIALELQHQYPELPERAPLRFGFIDRHPQAPPPWRVLARLPQPLPLPLNLWAIVPEIRKRDYPDRLRLLTPDHPTTRGICILDPDESHRLGFPYQRYRCDVLRQSKNPSF